MASTTSTFATLRALYMVVGDALDEIQRVFSQTTSSDIPPSSVSRSPSPGYTEPSPAICSLPPTPSASFPPTPISATFPSTLSSNTDTTIPLIDYPSPDMPYAPNSLSEQLAAHPDVCAAAARIVAACGQMSHIVHRPFLSLCDAVMSYNLPACMRFVEHLHIAEILREAEENRQRHLAQAQVSPVPSTGGSQTTNIFQNPKASDGDLEGMHITDITNVIHAHGGSNYVDPNDLVHVLRLLSTHHMFRETAPDTFALTRVASLLDTGKSVASVFSSPEIKYEDSDGTAAFVALTTDELFKSAAYLTEAFTGIQLPASRTAGSITGSALPTEITATSEVHGCPTNVLSLHTPGTRCSSILTRIVYPEYEGFQPPSCLVPSAETLEDIMSFPLPGDAPTRSSPLAMEPSLRPHPATPHPTPMKEGQLGGNIEQIEQEKLPAFNLAFRTWASYFDWLENGGKDPLGSTGQGACARAKEKKEGKIHCDVQRGTLGDGPRSEPRNSFRLERFSKAMTGTSGWEAPRAILSGFDWDSLPRGSTIVDVGGGIGSTAMTLARAFNNPARKHSSICNDALNLKPLSSNTVHRHKAKHPSDPSLMDSDELKGTRASKDDKNFRFIVQDRPVVTSLGIAAWRSQCPEMLESEQVEFQNQDFFQPQTPLRPPHISKNPAVYLLRVVLHDWPDQLARRILINLRVASSPETRLIIAEHVLPLACVDDGVDESANTERCEVSTNEWTLDSVLLNIEGAERTLAPPPLLPNLGKASANAYWMDLLMHIMFNGKERTLRELCALALSAGWRVTRMTRPEGTLFAHLVCEPVALPDDAMTIYNAVVLSSPTAATVPAMSDESTLRDEAKSPPRPVGPAPLLPSPIVERSSSRCGTPTFGSRVLLPNDDEMQTPSRRGAGTAKRWLKSKGLGVRSVVMQKADKREEPGTVKGSSSKSQDDTQSGVHASTSHTRVWWKKSPPNSAGASTSSIHELTGVVSEHRQTGRGRRATLRGNEGPSTPHQSPRLTPAHHPWPSTESVPIATPEASPPVPPIPKNRRPSVASITRKLSFVTFGRRPSVVDLNEPLPTPPPSARLTSEFAPPPSLDVDQDSGRKVKHLPSLPALGRGEVARPTERPDIRRPPSLSFASSVPALQPIPSPPVPRHPQADVVKQGILVKTPSTGSPSAGDSTELPVRTRRQRSVTLLSGSSPGTTRNPTQVLQTRASVEVPLPPVPTSSAKRIENLPKLPRRVSIPLLRRKQSQVVIHDAEDEGGGSGSG